MAGNAQGALACAARKAGISVEEYQALRRQGLKRCTACGRWKPQDDFSRDASRWDGLKADCRTCASARHRVRYVPVPEHERKKKGPALGPTRDGDALQARARINKDVKFGRRPDPDELHCVYCGHKGPDRRHEYHHHRGYAAQHHNDVLPACTPCHAREHARLRRGRRQPA